MFQLLCKELTTNDFFIGMILILAWEVYFTQAKLWALSWEAGFVLDLELILSLDWEVGYF